MAIEVKGEKQREANIRDLKGTCSYCGQERRTCGGKEEDHERITVRAQDPEFARYFQGVMFNNVYYKHSVLVPKDAAGWILAQAHNWEEDERNSRLARTRNYNLGSMAG